jgi:hypothetical protein
MRWRRRNNRKALKALVLSFAAMAIFAGNATAAQVHDGGSMVTPVFEPITSVAQQYGGTAELPAAQQAEIAYLSWGATAENTLPLQSTRDSGPVFMNGLPDGYVGSGISRDVTVPQVVGVSSPDGYQPQLRGAEQLVIRDAPDGFQPQSKQAEVVSVSAGSSSIETGDLALGFGLGLILATAGAIALAMSRNRERLAHP